MGLLNPNWNNWVNPGAPMGLKGLLAKQFDPKELRYQAGSQALLNAGIAMMNPDPKAPPSGILGAIGRGFAGGAQGAQEGADRFYNDGFRNVQLMDMQRQQDQRTKQDEAMAALIPTLPPEIQSFAKAYPKEFGEAYLKAKMPGDSGWQEVTLEDGVYAVNKANPTQKILIGDRANRNEGEGRDFKQSRDLRTDYTKASEPFEKKRIAYQNIVAAYEGANKNPDNPGPADIALIFSFMKMLDPSSTVMQGEYANAQNAGSVDQRLIAQYNSLIDGGKLAPEVRDAFIEQATAQYESQLSTYGNTRSTYQDLARQRGLNPDEVAPDYTYGIIPYKRKSTALKKKYGLE
jgi:hypothetical protein